MEAFENLPKSLQNQAQNLEEAIRNDAWTPKQFKKALDRFMVDFATQDREVLDTMAVLTGTNITPHSFSYALGELGRAWLWVMWEENRGLPNRWSDVLAELRAGRNTGELFPDPFYHDGPNTKQ